MKIKTKPNQTQLVVRLPALLVPSKVEGSLSKGSNLLVVSLSNLFQTTRIVIDRVKPKFFNSCKNSLTELTNSLKYRFFIALLLFILRNCHSALDAESRISIKWIPAFAGMTSLD